MGVGLAGRWRAPRRRSVAEACSAGASRHSYGPAGRVRRIIQLSCARAAGLHLALRVLHALRRGGDFVDGERRQPVWHVDAHLRHQLRALILVYVKRARLLRLRRLERPANPGGPLPEPAGKQRQHGGG
jgi:hypothetical protein